MENNNVELGMTRLLNNITFNEAETFVVKRGVPEYQVKVLTEELKRASLLFLTSFSPGKA